VTGITPLRFPSASSAPRYRNTLGERCAPVAAASGEAGWNRKSFTAISGPRERRRVINTHFRASLRFHKFRIARSFADKKTIALQAYDNRNRTVLYRFLSRSSRIFV
jgi:hypothetical protein